MELRFTVHGEPKGKGRPRFTKTGHAVTPKDTVIYENLVRMEYLNQCGETKFPDDAMLDIRIKAYYTIPPSKPKKKKELMRAGIIRPTKKPDMDNCIKIIADALNKKYGNGTIEIAIHDSYYNMKEKVEPVKFIVDIAEEAMKECDITPIIVPIRGGTDGARLSFMGLPCPNIFTGGLNFHSKNECIPIIALEKCSNLIVKIAQKYAQR